MTIKLDWTRESVVVWCDLCPSYAECAADRLEGWKLAVVHEVAVHPSFRQARAALFEACKDAAFSTVDSRPHSFSCEAD